MMQRLARIRKRVCMNFFIEKEVYTKIQEIFYSISKVENPVSIISFIGSSPQFRHPYPSLLGSHCFPISGKYCKRTP